VVNSIYHFETYLSATLFLQQRHSSPIFGKQSLLGIDEEAFELYVLKNTMV